jgi:hypothetical protein
MRIDLDDLRRHYASLPDGALRALDRAELSEAARPLYDEEVARRALASDPAAVSFEQPEEIDDVDFDVDSGPDPDWLDDAACACSFLTQNQYSNDGAADASAALHAAGIPCHIVMHEEDPPKTSPAKLHYLRVMVPVPLALHAMSVLDTAIFNAEHEAELRASLEMLSDNDLRKLKPEILCAGLLDRVARLKKAYEDELERRKFIRL